MKSRACSAEGADAHASWRPDPTALVPLTGHAAHMAIVNGPYLDSIHAMRWRRHMRKGYPLE